MMTVRWQYAILALLLAISTWFLVTGREKVETWVPMTVEMINVPEELLIQDGLVTKIDVRVRGPKGLVRALDEKKLVYSLDARNLKLGENLIEFKADKVPLSQAYEVLEVRPGRAILLVDRIASKTVPVEPKWTAEDSLAGNYKLTHIRAEPSHVEVRGPQSVLRTLGSVEATLMTPMGEPVPDLYSEKVPVVTPDEVEPTPGLVEIVVEIAPVTQVVPVKLRNFEADAPAGYTAEVLDDYVLLEIEGPRFLFANDEYRQDMAAVVRFEDDVSPGEHMLEYWVKLPQRCRLVSKEPGKLKVKVEKP